MDKSVSVLPKFQIGDIVTDDGKYRWVVITDRPLQFQTAFEAYGMVGISKGNLGRYWMHMADHLEFARPHPHDKKLKELAVLLYG